MLTGCLLGTVPDRHSRRESGKFNLNIFGVGQTEEYRPGIFRSQVCKSTRAAEQQSGDGRRVGWMDLGLVCESISTSPVFTGALEKEGL